MGKKDEGILLVVSGESGAGKGTICNEIRNIYPELNYSISMTTRTARVGKKRGQLLFRSKEEFERLIKEEAFWNMHVYTAIITEHQRKVFLI